MKRNVEDWTVAELHKERGMISFPEYQRQDNLWSEEKKSLLIDSILRNIDIPKIYFNVTPGGNIEVVDGQQRLWAIWGFLDDDYSLKLDGKAQKFSELSQSRKDTITKYKLQVSVLDDADDEYLRELFIRLQLGLLLVTGEKLKAATGAMKSLVFEKLATHQFVRNLHIPNRRFARQTLCAQICINSFTQKKVGEFARTRYEDLQYFFKEYEKPLGQDLEFFRDMSKKIDQVMQDLALCLGDRVKDLRSRAYILSVYLFFEALRDDPQFDLKTERKQLSDFVFKLWKRLKEEIKAGMDRKNRELYVFETLVSSASGEKYQIEGRHEKLGEYYAFFKKHGKIKGDP